MFRFITALAAALFMALPVGANASDAMGAIKTYVESLPLPGRSADALILKAWGCNTTIRLIQTGAQTKANGIEWDSISPEQKATMEPEHLALIKRGFDYDGPMDDRINSIYAQCLIDAHKESIS